jgi:hypothetical protein
VRPGLGDVEDPPAGFCAYEIDVELKSPPAGRTVGNDGNGGRTAAPNYAKREDLKPSRVLGRRDQRVIPLASQCGRVRGEHAVDVRASDLPVDASQPAADKSDGDSSRVIAPRMHAQRDRSLWVPERGAMLPNRRLRRRLPLTPQSLSSAVAPSQGRDADEDRRD